MYADIIHSMLYLITKPIIYAYKIYIYIITQYLLLHDTAAAHPLQGIR
jgi:hypothetical protein